MPSRQERRKVSVGSISFLILISASRTIGPHLSISTKIGVDAGVLAVIGVPAIDLELAQIGGAVGLGQVFARRDRGSSWGVSVGPWFQLLQVPSRVMLLRAIHCTDSGRGGRCRARYRCRLIDAGNRALAMLMIGTGRWPHQYDAIGDRAPFTPGNLVGHNPVHGHRLGPVVSRQRIGGSSLAAIVPSRISTRVAPWNAIRSMQVCAHGAIP